ncbi:hypothetical protein FV242_26805 [Methylobacterium sp. WL64]|nr:hypothetical protein FV242_26805 [Methylobacterium sp. WL64]
MLPLPTRFAGIILAVVRCAIWRERTLTTSPRRRARTKPRFYCSMVRTRSRMVRTRLARRGSSRRIVRRRVKQGLWL